MTTLIVRRNRWVMAQVKIDLSFTVNNDIDVDYITQKIGMLPTQAVESNGLDSAVTLGLHQFENKWSISTDITETDDAECLIEELLSLMIPKKDLLAEMSTVFGGTWMVRIVGLVHKGEIPAVYLGRRFLDFCKDIQAGVLYDIQVSPNYNDDV